MITHLLVLAFFFSTSPDARERSIRQVRAGCDTDVQKAWLLATAGRDTTGCLVRVPAPQRRMFSTVLAAGELRRKGKLSEAADLLKRAFKPSEPAPVLRFVLAEILLFQGQNDEAMGLVDRIVDDFEREFIGKTPWELWAAGSAAVLKRDWEAAEEAFNRLDRDFSTFVPGQIAGGEYDRIREYYARSLRRLRQAVQREPWHPPALIALARALFENPYMETSGEAVSSAKVALEVDPDAIGAAQLLAKIAIYDLHYPEALSQLANADRIFPDHPLTLAYRGAIELLHGRSEKYQEIFKRFMERYPKNLEFFTETGRILNRHHRYPLAVEQFQKGLKLEPDNPALSAWLGISLLRVGNEGDGVYHLRRAAVADPEHVLANNVTRLYTNVVFPTYESVRQGPFLYRVPRDEWPVLSRIVPPVMEAAWERYKKVYRFTPPEPVRVELYRNPADFTTLIAGQPVDTGILGVCFGRVIVALSPSAGRANWAMVLVHELAHTFHVEQTRGRVPRWFTEGLAEMETARYRTVWRREMSRDLYMALSERSLRGITQLNEAFSHAKDELEMVTAYIHATWVVRFILLHHGWPAIRRMLALYEKELPTGEVIAEALGVSPEEFDRRFFAYLSRMFARYENQFHPSAIRFADRNDLLQAVERKPDAESFGRLALWHFLANERDDHRLVLDKAIRLDSNNRWVLFAGALVARSERNHKLAMEKMEEIVRSGHDGLEIRQFQAFLHQMQNQRDEEIRVLEKASMLDPENIQVRLRLAKHYQDTGQNRRFVQLLREVSRLSEGDSGVARLLVELGIKEKNHAQTAEFGELLLEIAPFGHGQVFLDVANSFFRMGQPARALPFLEVYRAQNPEDRLGRVRLMLARSLVASGRKKEAIPHLEQLVKLFPGMVEAKKELEKIR